MAHLLTLPKRIGYEWFDQRQRGLVELVATRWGREFLRLPAECEGLPVVALWPNAVHVALPNGQRRAVFYSRPVFAERVRRFAQWERRYGTLGAALRASDPRLQMVELAVAATTFNPDDPAVGTSVDGYVARSGVDEIWATIRAGAGNTANDSAATAIAQQIYESATGGQYQALSRGIFLFDTSSIGGSAVLLSATFSLYGSTKNALTSDTMNLSLVPSTPASNTALANADYANVGSTLQSATSIEVAAFSTAGYNDFPLNATGLGNVSKTGITKFGTRSHRDIDNAAPTAWTGSINGHCTGLAADNGSNKPKLVVNYMFPVVAFMMDFI